MMLFLQSNVRALKVALFLYMFLILGGTLALYVVPQWSDVINSCPAYGLAIITLACLSIVLSLGVSQLCADAVTRTVTRLSKFGEVEWRLEHGILVSAIASIVLCGILFQNFYLTYMPLAGLIIYMLLHRHNRAYLSHVWLREFLLLVTTVTISALIAPIVPIIFMIVAGLLSGRTRLATALVIVYTTILAVAVVRLVALGYNPVSILVPGFAMFTTMSTIKGFGMQIGTSGTDVPDVVTKTFQFLVTNSYIAFLEEQLGRAVIPFVGPVLPTALFISLHIPTRVGLFFSPSFIAASVPEYAVVMVVTTITMIAIATVFLVRTYCLSGLIPTILVHMLYNTYIDTVAMNVVAGLTLLAIMMILYVIFNIRRAEKELEDVASVVT